ncbi:hypothetical protein [Ancylobacter polymorphus]|uniref:Histidine kinase n=1 Tax=Ancylobacter polymorphus TaxID=223390 RepID=A0ABU0BEH1_9HYPH|nr:hypothetical protein [Ancylobacter polymorphus]MDQ0304009.1 hypothetical protein [Ancylobacter polymorphus]
MADYYPLIARAVGGLPDKTAEARKAVYERARRALLAQLTAVDPPLSAPDVAREQQALETAIDRVEADFGGTVPAAPPRAPVAPLAPVSPPAAVAAPPAPPPVTRAPLTAANPPAPPVTPSPVSPAAFPEAAPPPRWSGRSPERPVERAPEVGTGFHPSEAEAVAAGLEPPRGAGRPSDWRSEAARLVREREAGEAAQDIAREGARASGESLPNTANSGEEAPVAEAPAAKGGRSRLIAIGLFVLLLIAGGVVGYTQRATIVALLHGGSAGTSAPSAQAPATPARADAPKSTDRITQASGEPASAPASAPQAAGGAEAGQSTDQRAVLFEESPGGGEQGLQQYVGTVEWSTEQASAGAGQPTDLGVRAEISIPARNFSATLTFRRNQDPSIPASHIVEVQFKLPPGFDLGNISSVPGMRAKASEGAQGAPLVGLAVRVAPNYFLIGLSSLPADVQRNLGFIITRNWLDLPLVFENGRRAILVLDKGGAGQAAFRQAYTAWGLAPATPPAQQDQNPN